MKMRQNNSMPPDNNSGPGPQPSGNKPGRKDYSFKLAAKDIALIAVLSAIIVAGKFIAQFLPNIEPVTLLLFVYTCVFGWRRTALVSLVFCALDMLLYSFSVDVAVTYFIYWPLLTAVIKIINFKGMRSEYVNAYAAAAMTFLFGIMTSAAGSVMTGAPFIGIYIKGILFFAIHIVANFLIVMFAFKPLTKVLFKLKNTYSF